MIDFLLPGLAGAYLTAYLWALCVLYGYVGRRVVDKAIKGGRVYPQDRNEVLPIWPLLVLFRIEKEKPHILDP